MNNSTLWKALINQESSSPYPDNATVFKILGSFIINCSIIPVGDCVVDFGNGDIKIYPGSNSRIFLNSTYDSEGEYIIQITGNHSRFIASKNSIEIIQLSNTLTTYDNIFEDCNMLTKLPVGFSIPDNITSCQYMFSNCRSLTTLPDGFTIPDSVTNSFSLFYNCRSLTTLPDGFRLSNSCDTTRYVFYECSSLVSLPDGFFIPDSVTNANETFVSCVSLTTLPNGFTIPKNTPYCSSMFNGCSNLKSIPSSLIIPENLRDGSNMFNGCTSLTTDISNIFPPYWNNRLIGISLAYAFNNCSKITGTVPANKLWNADVSWNNVSKCFANCTSLTNYDEIPAEWK